MVKNKGLFTSEIWNDIVILENPDKWYFLNEIAKKRKNTPEIMEKHLDLATKLNILIKKGRGRRIFYKLNPKDQRVKNMLEQMKTFRKGAVNIISLMELDKKINLKK